ncbi:MAG: tol-pal system-associated acyl-CoA thioesterase [Sulfuricellaceae bacterium]
MTTATQNAESDAAFSWPVRVYYEDTDSGGVVYYANYLKFLERARSEWLRALGFGQIELLRDFNVLFVVRRAEIDYLKPAVFDDLLTVTVREHEAGRSWIELDQTIARRTIDRDSILVKARIKVACVNGLTFKPVAMPAQLQFAKNKTGVQ